MVRALKWLLAIPLLLAAGWAAVVWSGALPRLDPAQQQALSMMRAPPQQAVGARNAYPLLWALPYEVPAELRAGLLDRDVERYLALAPAERGGFASEAATLFPGAADGGDAERLCGRSDCLAQVRADPEAARAAHGTRAAVGRRLLEFRDYDHVRSPFPPSLGSPITPLARAGNVQLTGAALRFVDGDADGALEQLCDSMAGLRQLKGRSDSLIFEMVALSWLADGAQLFASMRAELALDHALPPSCATAFAPADGSQRHGCDVYRSEFAMAEDALGPGAAAHHESPAWVLQLINRRATLALFAEHHARSCAAVAGEPEALSAPPGRARACAGALQLFNPFGCVLAAIGTGDYSRYALREHDLERRLQALETADWLARQPDPQAAFAARSPPVGGLRFDGQRLAVELLAPRQDETGWEIPLPASLRR